MNKKTACLAAAMVVCFAMIVGVAHSEAKVPDSFRDIKLGMNKPQVIELLRKNPTHFSFEDMGDEVGEIIRGHDLFRYATYRFDKAGVLVEIGLQMREIIGRDKCIETFNQQYGLQLTPLSKTGDSEHIVEVRDNTVILRLAAEKDMRSAAK